MSPHKTLLGLASIAGLLLGVGLALAEDVPPMPGRQLCQENPGKCEEARARHQAFCQENPQKCAQMKQRRAERRAFCQENPEKCEQQRAQMKARRAEMTQKCAADPARCQEIKRQMREQMQQHHGMGAPPPKPAE